MKLKYVLVSESRVTLEYDDCTQVFPEECDSAVVEDFSILGNPFGKEEGEVAIDLVPLKSYFDTTTELLNVRVDFHSAEIRFSIRVTRLP